MAFDLTGMVVSSHERRKVKVARRQRRDPKLETFYLGRPNLVRNQDRKVKLAVRVARDGTTKKIVVRDGTVRAVRTGYFWSKVFVNKDSLGTYVPRAR